MLLVHLETNISFATIYWEQFEWGPAMVKSTFAVFSVYKVR